MGSEMCIRDSSQVEALKEFGISTSKEIPEKLLLEAEDDCLEGVFAND